MKSKLDKVSYESMLAFLENIQMKASEFVDVKSLLSLNKDVSHSIYFIEEASLSEMFDDILGEDNEKLNFLRNILLKFDLILPIEKKTIDRSFRGNFLVSQTYIVPFLFPFHKPKTVMINGVKLKKIEKRQEWKVTYYFDFKPSSVWKLLFLRLRKTFLRNENFVMLDERYWINGFYFNFKEKNHGKKNFYLHLLLLLFFIFIFIILFLFTNFYFLNYFFKDDGQSTIVDLSILNEINSVKKEVMQIILKSNFNLQPLFIDLQKNVKEFISEWMNKGRKNPKDSEISFEVTKKSIENERSVPLQLSIDEKKTEGLCCNCFLPIIYSPSITKCEICMSNNFLIENKYLVKFKKM